MTGLQRRTRLAPGKPLVRKTALKTTVPLQRGSGPARTPVKAKPARKGDGEVSARQIVTQRSAGACEWVGCQRPATDWSHRKARSQGGPWCASNGAHLCAHHHRYLHDHPETARTLGLHVPSWAAPRTTAAYLGPNKPGLRPGWYLLAPDGSLTWVPRQPPAPVLPAVA